MRNWGAVGWRWATRIWALALLLTLTGCAVPGLEGTGTDRKLNAGSDLDYAFVGRIVVRQPQRADSAQIQWINHPQEQQVELSSVLGTTLARLEVRPGTVRLWLSSQEQYQARDPESLTKEVLGYPLPLEGLPWWVLGRPVPNSAFSFTSSGQGEMLKLQQDGWEISYEAWRSVGERKLPGELTLRRGALTLRLRIDQWTLGVDSRPVGQLAYPEH